MTAIVVAATGAFRMLAAKHARRVLAASPSLYLPLSLSLCVFISAWPEGPYWQTCAFERCFDRSIIDRHRSSLMIPSTMVFCVFVVLSRVALFFFLHLHLTCFPRCFLPCPHHTSHASRMSTFAQKAYFNAFIQF